MHTDLRELSQRPDVWRQVDFLKGEKLLRLTTFSLFTAAFTAVFLLGMALLQWSGSEMHTEIGAQMHFMQCGLLCLVLCAAAMVAVLKKAWAPLVRLVLVLVQELLVLVLVLVLVLLLLLLLLLLMLLMLIVLLVLLTRSASAAPPWWCCASWARSRSAPCSGRARGSATGATNVCWRTG